MLGRVDTEGPGTLESSLEEEGSEVLTGGDVSEAVAGVEQNKRKLVDQSIDGLYLASQLYHRMTEHEASNGVT